MEPYMWIKEFPGHFDPQNGGEPPSTDFSDTAKPGYAPLYCDDRRDDIIAALRTNIGNMLNAKIALDVGDTKAKVSAQLASALKTAEDALAKATA